MGNFINLSGKSIGVKAVQGLLALALVSGISGANAATVSLVASKPVYRGTDGGVTDIVYFTPGEQVKFDVVISELGNGASPSLGAYDLKLIAPTDANGNTFDGITYGTGLGTTITDAVSFSTDKSNVDGSSLQMMRISQVSLESAAKLIADQPSSFTLASILFTFNSGSIISVLAGKYTDINGNIVDGGILSDENGDPITHNPTTGYDYSFNIRPGSAPVVTPVPVRPPSAVTLPAAWVLFSGGLALIGGVRKWSIKRHPIA